MKVESAKENIERLYQTYCDMVFRICLMYFRGNTADAEDAAAEVFIRYIDRDPILESREHEKAWLISTSRNVCRNMLKHWWRKNVSIDDAGNRLPTVELQTDEIARAVFRLPEKQKLCVYLYYYEGYSCKEISGIMQIGEGAVSANLSRGRKRLRGLIGEDEKVD